MDKYNMVQGITQWKASVLFRVIHSAPGGIREASQRKKGLHGVLRDE